MATFDSGRWAEILDTSDTVSQAVTRWARERPDHPAIVGPGDRSLTWAQLDEQADRCADWLARQGIGAGSRIGYVGRNHPDAVVVYLAARRLRAAVAGFNWRLSAAETARCIAVVAPDLMVVDELGADLVEDPTTPVVAIGTFQSPWRDCRRHQGFAAPAGPDEIALFWFTSGSTGTPKAVALGAERIELAVAEHPGYDISVGDQMLIVPPIFHAAGSIWMHYVLSRGATAHFIADASPAALVAALTGGGITHMLSVPILLAAVVDEIVRTGVSAPSLQYVCYGTSPVPEPLLRRAIEVLGCGFVGVYGLTELGGVVSRLPADQHDPDGPFAHRLRSVGRPQPGAGVRVGVARADGTPAAVGEVGVVTVSSPTAMLGYLVDGALIGGGDAETPISTGDLGYLDDDDYLYLVGRADDMIITGGENVSPAQIEDVLSAMPGVAECAVFGVDDPTWGQRVAAAIVSADGTELAADDVIAYCRDRLAHYKCPTVVVAMTELPRTATGKVLRAKLGVPA